MARLTQFGLAAIAILLLWIADSLWQVGWHKYSIVWKVWAFAIGVEYVFEAWSNFDKGRK